MSLFACHLRILTEDMLECHFSLPRKGACTGGGITWGKTGTSFSQPSATLEAEAQIQ